MSDGLDISSVTFLLVLALVCSILIGPRSGDIFDFGSGLRGGETRAVDIVLHARLPRTVLGAIVGAALGVAGLLMQIMTRNPLASAQTFGVSAGASAAMVGAMIFTPAISALGVFPAVVGACIGGILVWSLGFRLGTGVASFALVGISVHLLFSSLVEGMAVLHDASVDIVFWLAGSISGAQWNDVVTALPWVGLAILIAIASARSLRVFGLGREAATALGLNYLKMSAHVGALVIVLAGTAVAVAGPIGFIGLLVPHLVRPDPHSPSRSSIVAVALGGAMILTAADVLGRLIYPASDMPAGVVTALVGAPVYLFLAAKRGNSGCP